MPNLIVSAVSTFDNKGLKKGRKEVAGFDKQLKTFAKTFGAAFSVTALTRFGKAAVKAFADDEKAARSLEQQLKNTGFAFSSPAVELFIANLQKTTGVVDDQLRPAFQQLLTVTGSITKSQDALNTALNISAGTGREVTAVTAALARAYAGNTTGLSRLGAGLDKNLLKAGDMNKIMAELNKKFSGQSAARLETYAGKMSLLSVAAADAQEIIGKGIVDALTLLSDDKTIENLTDSMQDFATATSEVIVGLGTIAAKLKQLTTIPGVGSVFDIKNIPILGAIIPGLRALGRAPQQDRGGQERTAARIAKRERVLEARAIKNSTALRKAENDQLKKKTAIDELKDKFDLERIGLTVALNEATDAETKLRIKAQLAILDNNEALAKKILAEMQAAEAAKKLAAAYDNALESVKLMNAKIAAFLLSMSMQGFNVPALGATKTGGGTKGLGGAAAPVPTGIVAGSRFDPAAFRRGEEKSMIGLDIVVSTQNTGDKFAQLIAESLQVSRKLGISSGITGGL